MKKMNLVDMQKVNAGFRLATYGSCNYCGYCSLAYGTLGAIYVYKKIEKHCKQSQHFRGAFFTEKKILW